MVTRTVGRVVLVARQLARLVLVVAGIMAIAVIVLWVLPALVSGQIDGAAVVGLVALVVVGAIAGSLLTDHGHRRDGQRGV
jgi:hypothetical protein